MPEKKRIGKQRSSRSQKKENGTGAKTTSSLSTKDLLSIFQTDALISAETFKENGRPQGSKPGPIFLRPLDDQNDGNFPDPDDPVDPCRGQPFVAVPLIAAQLDLGSSPMQVDCPSSGERQRIAGAVRSQFSRLLSNAEVQVPPCVNKVLTVVVWSSVNSDPCIQKARERGLRQLRLTSASNNFGFFLNRTLIVQQALRAFSIAPKQLDEGNGAPSPFGAIHLTGLTVEFAGPNKVRTKITGYDERPWPDVNFTLTITDTLLDNRECTTTSKVTTDESAWIAALNAALLGCLSVIIPVVLPLTLFVLFNDLDAVINQPDNSGEGGVGCRALELVPPEIPLPDHKKLVPTYGNARVTSGGLFVPAVILGTSDRQPAARLLGPTKLNVSENMGATFDFFEVATSDTFGTVSVNWSGGPGVTIESPTQRRTRITFARGNRNAGSPSFTRTIRATVADQDGFTQTVTKEVEIFVLEKDTLPPKCRAKPWLPDCKPGQL
jgi:hypothetical protein